MTSVNNVKGRFCISCIITAFFAMCLLVGCDSSKLITRSYPLGRHPKTAKEIAEEIATDEVVKHLNDEQKRSSRMLIKPVPEEGCLIVKTTSAGHRKIEAELKRLEEQSTAP